MVTAAPATDATSATTLDRSETSATAELYRAVEALPEVLDSLVVDLEYLGQPSWMPLFVVLREGVPLDDVLKGRLKAEVRQALSPRHVPDEIFQVASLPRTL